MRRCMDFREEPGPIEELRGIVVQELRQLIKTLEEAKRRHPTASVLVTSELDPEVVKKRVLDLVALQIVLRTEPNV